MAIVFDQWAILAGTFASIAIVLSLYEIFGHLCYFNKPYLQRYIVRILLMVPVYCLNAWFAMILPSTGIYLDSMREVYESFVIYSFMKYLLNYLKYETNLQQYIDRKPGPKHVYPLCCLPACVGGTDFLARCKNGILQYVVVRPITSMMAFTSHLFNFYGEGNYNPFSGYMYPVLLIINNVSQISAMYCLLIFYTGYYQELAPMKPLLKFFSIKLVVFFSFFQSVVISGLLEIQMVEYTLRELFPEITDKIEIARKAQELLICFDMFLAAIGHVFAFSYKPFKLEMDEERARLETGSSSYNIESGNCGGHDDRSYCRAICNLFDFSEERTDVREHFSGIYSKVRSFLTFGPLMPTIEPTQQQQQQNGNTVIENSMNNNWMLTVASENENEQQSNGSNGQANGRLEGTQDPNSNPRNYQSIK